MDEQQTTSTCIVVSMLGGEVVLNRKQVEHIVEVSGKLEAQRNQLRAERDALKARVEELENTIDCGCNALTDSICCSGNDADTNLGFVRKMKRVLIGNNPTTPGGDE